MVIRKHRKTILILVLTSLIGSISLILTSMILRMIVCNYSELLCDGSCVTVVDYTAVAIPTMLRFTAVITIGSIAIVVDSAKDHSQL